MQANLFVVELEKEHLDLINLSGKQRILNFFEEITCRIITIVFLQRVPTYFWILPEPCTEDLKCKL